MKGLCLWIIFISSVAWASPATEEYELNYAKALLEYNDHHPREALSILSKNFTSNPLHVASFELVAKIHEETKHPLKALRVYLFLIKRHGGKDWIISRTESDWRTLPRPSEQLLGQMFKIGLLFIDIAHQKEAEFTKNKTLQTRRYRRILDQSYDSARKYFRLCRFYHFQNAESEYELGIIEKAQKNYSQADTHLDQADQLIDDDSLNDDEGAAILHDAISLQLGENELGRGRPDVALRFFKTIYATTRDPGFKKMASIYLDALQASSFNIGAGLGGGYDSNVSMRSDEDKKTDTSTNSGPFVTREASTYYASAMKNNMTHAWSASLSDLLYAQSALNTSESRLMALNYTPRWATSDRATLRLDSGILFFQNRETTDAKFSTYSRSYRIAPGMTLNQHQHTWGLAFPLTLTDYTRYAGTRPLDMRAEGSWSPSTNLPLLSPSLTISLQSSRASGLLDAQSGQSISFTNTSAWTSSHSLIAGLSYARSRHDETDLNNDRWDLRLIDLIDWRNLLQGLSSSLSLTNSVEKSGVTLSESATRFQVLASANYMY